jgi:hypothetical protein
MGLEFTCFIKRFFIVALSTILLGSVGIAPDQPVIFAIIFAVCVSIMRFLWSSAQKDEKAIRKHHIRMNKRIHQLPQEFNRAA